MNLSSIANSKEGEILRSVQNESAFGASKNRSRTLPVRLRVHALNFGGEPRGDRVPF